MKIDRKLSRRSFMARVVGGTVVGGAALTVLGSSAGALQVSDSDSGANSDPPGRGRTGVTDNDTGNGSDRPGHGRSGQRRAQGRGCTDNDSGANADRAGSGRGTGRSDSDTGANADPANCGRR